MHKFIDFLYTLLPWTRNNEKCYNKVEENITKYHVIEFMKGAGTMGEIYSVQDLAKYVISYCVNRNSAISNLQLQKILYFIQLAFIKQYNTPAFCATFEAWQHGPVIRELYLDYCIYGPGKIYELHHSIENTLFVNAPDKGELANQTIEKYCDMNPWNLVELSHLPNSPWDKVYEEGKKNEIPTEIIYEYVVGKDDKICQKKNLLGRIKSMWN